MQAVNFSGRLREDGSISLPTKMRQKLGLRAGDKVEIFIYPVGSGKAAAKSATEMPLDRQERLDELLFRHREGELSPYEKRELEALVLEAQLLTVEKAKRLLRRRR